MTASDCGCSAAYNACCANCWTDDPPWPYTQNAYYHYCCNVVCQAQYMACLAACAVSDAVDTVVDYATEAAEWVAGHPEEIAIGTVVVIGGVTFVAVASPFMVAGAASGTILVAVQ